MISTGKAWSVDFKKKKNTQFFRAVLSSQQKWVESIKNSHTSYTHTASPISSIPIRGIHLLELIKLHWHTTIAQSELFPLGFTLDVVHAVSLNQCITIWSIIIISSSFITLKILSALSICPSLSPNPWQLAIDLFIVSTVLPFPECHILTVRIIPYVPFSDWLFFT